MRRTVGHADADQRARASAPRSSGWAAIAASSRWTSGFSTGRLASIEHRHALDGELGLDVEQHAQGGCIGPVGVVDRQHER